MRTCCVSFVLLTGGQTMPPYVLLVSPRCHLSSIWYCLYRTWYRLYRKAGADRLRCFRDQRSARENHYLSDGYFDIIDEQTKREVASTSCVRHFRRQKF